MRVPSIFSRTQLAQYYSKQEGGYSWQWAMQNIGGSAYGDYMLLRVPPDAGPFQIDGRTGWVSLSTRRVEKE